MCVVLLVGLALFAGGLALFAVTFRSARQSGSFRDCESLTGLLVGVVVSAVGIALVLSGIWIGVS